MKKLRIRITYTYTKTKVRNNNGRMVDLTIPSYVCKSATIYNETGILFLTYFNRCQNNLSYRVALGCMTVQKWNTFMIGKHKMALRRIKGQILEKFSISSKRFDDALEIAEDFYDIVMTCLGVAGKMSIKVEIANAVYNVIKIIAKYINKVSDRQDKYIRNIIKGKNKTDNVLILLDREDFVYNSIYYQKGIYWVCETGWHSQRVVRMY